MAGAGAQVEVALVIHGTDLHDRHIDRLHILKIVAGKLGILQMAIEAEPLCDCLALETGHMPAVPGHMCCRILDLEDLRLTQQNAAVEVDIIEIRKALCQLPVHCPGSRGCPRVVDPVTGFDDRSCCRCAHELLSVLILITHAFLSFVLFSLFTIRQASVRSLHKSMSGSE
jgi:hypothetical protein